MATDRREAHLGDAAPSRALEALLLEDEQLLWHARARPIAIYAKYLAVVLVTGLVGWPSLAIFVNVDVTVEGASANLGLVAWISLLALLVAGLAARQRARHAEYAVTDQRLIAFGGIVGRDYSAVKWGDVREHEVDVGPVDALFGTGTVGFTVAGTAALEPGVWVTDDDRAAGVFFPYVPAPYEALSDIEALVEREGRPRPTRAA